MKERSLVNTGDISPGIEHLMSEHLYVHFLQDDHPRRAVRHLVSVDVPYRTTASTTTVIASIVQFRSRPSLTHLCDVYRTVRTCLVVTDLSPMTIRAVWRCFQDRHTITAASSFTKKVSSSNCRLNLKGAGVSATEFLILPITMGVAMKL